MWVWCVCEQLVWVWCAWERLVWLGRRAMMAVAWWLLWAASAPQRERELSRGGGQAYIAADGLPQAGWRSRLGRGGLEFLAIADVAGFMDCQDVWVRGVFSQDGTSDFIPPSFS